MSNSRQAAASSAPDPVFSVPNESLERADSCTQLVVPGSQDTVHRARLLLVDDDAEVRRALGRLLRGQGYYVDSAAGGSEAVDYVDQNSYDVVVSDIRMPGMDGIQLLREIRKHDLHVPVVLLTGVPAIRTAVQALEFGAFHYLTKPIDQQELEKVLDKAARLRRMAKLKLQAAELLGRGAGPGGDRVALEASFERCIANLWMAYHPIVDFANHTVFGHEALMRSLEPSLPHPGAVLDAAERLGRLDELGRIVRDLAAVPYGEDGANGKLFVNLHVTDLADPSLTDPDTALCRIADRVVLEITERSSLDEVKDARHRVARLRELGFRIAVDDMGSGYAGLTSFALLEPEYVKLDMSLIRDVHLSPTKQKVIRSMNDLCRDMGMKVVAEGVETTEERDTLLEIGCDLLQGFLFAKPGKPFPEVAW